MGSYLLCLTKLEGMLIQMSLIRFKRVQSIREIQINRCDKHDAIDSVPSLHGKRLERERDITAAITKSCSEDTKGTGMLMVLHAHSVFAAVHIVKHCIG